VSRWWTESRRLHLAAPVSAGMDAADGVSRGQAVLAAWGEQLDRQALPAGTRVHAVISDALLRYRLVPWHARLSSPTERMALARQGFTEAFGDLAARWTVQVEPARHGQAGLACAVDSSLVEGVVQALAARQLRLHSLQPMLAWALNPLRRQIARMSGGSDACFVLQHAGGSTWLWLADEGLRHVRQIAGPVDLEQAWRREWFSLGAEGQAPPLLTLDLRAGSIDGGADGSIDGSASAPSPATTLHTVVLRAPLSFFVAQAPGLA